MCNHNMIIVVTNRWQGMGEDMPVSLQRILGIRPPEGMYYKVRSDFYECHWCPKAYVLYTIRQDSGTFARNIPFETFELEEVKNDG